MPVDVLPAASRAVTVTTFTPVCSATVALQFVVPVAVPFPPRSFTQLTELIPTLSLAVPASVTVAAPALKVPAVVGLVIATLGAVASGAYVTFNVSEDMLPAASYPVIERTFVPLCSGIVAVQLVVPDAVPFPPRLFTHLIWVTPTLSLAVPPSAIDASVVLYVAAEVGLVMVTTGAVVSSPLRVIVSTSVETLPAASRAVTVTTLTPLCSATVALQLVVPVAVPFPPRSLDQVTCVTPTLSLAVPPSPTDDAVVVNVVAAVGVVIVTEGAVVSPAPVTVHVKVREADNAPSDTDAVTL